MMKRAQWLSVLLAAAALEGARQLPAMEPPMIGEPAPAFDLPTLDGDNVSSDDLRGQYIVLHFGAGW